MKPFFFITDLMGVCVVCIAGGDGAPTARGVLRGSDLWKGAENATEGVVEDYGSRDQIAVTPSAGFR